MTLGLSVSARVVRSCDYSRLEIMVATTDRDGDVIRAKSLTPGLEI